MQCLTMYWRNILRAGDGASIEFAVSGLCPLMVIAIAIPIVQSARGDVLALPAMWHFGQWAGLAVLAWVGWYLYRTATWPAASSS